ncbi:MAG: hypothetical protein Q8916_08130 [Bacteroidota bacterium]|nr:hypothetical protein [Bacteroidota bacterium]MDP4230353.1 hypothetical protein [Bacteroidota bacterium]MDP4236253.1 hypothetical protein [Bacteroidota bacterium]
MNRITLIILLSVSFLAASCKSPSSPSQANYGDLIPIKTGNQWIYQSTSSDTTGNVIAVHTDTSIVGLAVEIDSSIWNVFTFPGSTLLQAQFISSRNDGLWLFDDQQSGTPLLEFKYPSNIGEENVVLNDSSGLGNGSVIQFVTKLVSSTESVTTKAGVFICYHYQDMFKVLSPSGNVQFSQNVADIFITPGVGIIKISEPTDAVTLGTFNKIPMTIRLLTEMHLQ